mmetsp:Transcript_136620/g.237200  ORF Transcript_136620/g.237200 Transcript_136620/m.237200 type:complete len:403 (+) Transcript_136620:1523-2731(+)
MGGAVREDEPIDTELGVVDGVPEVPAISPVLHALRGRLGQPLVHPVPNEPTLQPGVRVERLPVLVDIAIGVAHGMRVLTENEGPGLLRLADGLLDLLHSVVHGAQDVGEDRVHAGIPLVVQYPSVVQLPHQRRHCRMVGSAACFIAEGPEQNAAVVLVPGDHAPCPLQVRIAPVLVVRQQRHGLAAVGLQVGLIHHVQAVLVAKLVPQRVGGIVGAADGIEVMLLHDEDVLDHTLPADHVPRVWVMLMPVHPPDRQRDPVDVDDVVLHLHLPHPNLAPLHILHLLQLQQLHDQCVKVGGLRVPLNRVRQRGLQRALVREVVAPKLAGQVRGAAHGGHLSVVELGLDHETSTWCVGAAVDDEEGEVLVHGQLTVHHDLVVLRLDVLVIRRAELDMVNAGVDGP